MSDRSSPRATSTVVAVWQRLIAVLSTATDAWFERRVQPLARGFGTAMTRSGLASIGARLAQWIRASFIYRWLTAEPDPEVIVIDLRETYTVGPLLTALDYCVTPFAGAWRTARSGTFVRNVYETVRDQPVRTASFAALGALLTEFVFAAGFGTLSISGSLVRLLFVGLALLGTRVRMSWDDCTDSMTYQYLAAALAPPEATESDDADNERRAE